MRTEKVLPETLLQLMLNVLETAPDFMYQEVVVTFLKDHYPLSSESCHCLECHILMWNRLLVSRKRNQYYEKMTQYLSF